ncbi:TPA: hypothetical protein EYP26_04595 [Candidatus Bathyarchaeota archaeon]|nr:hypothetical protein [Candidatus Bathyarchaeota archaeon]
MGSATNLYRPVEAKLGYARKLILLLEALGATFYACTKSNLTLRDLGIYPRLWTRADRRLHSLDPEFSKVFEPTARGGSMP